MGIGFRELLIILLIALVLFGAKKLKSVGSDLGSAVRGFKKAMSEGEDEQNKQLSDLTGNATKDADFNSASTKANSDTKPSEPRMFEVGFTEIVLIFGIALLVLGPARLPKLAADLGRWAGRARAMARQLRTQLEQEVNQFDPLAPDTARKPAAGPIHSPAPAPAPAAGPGVPEPESIAADATPSAAPPPVIEGQAMARDAALAEPAPAQAVPPPRDKDGL